MDRDTYKCVFERTAGYTVNGAAMHWSGTTDSDGVQKQKCTGCGACLNVCEHQAIQWNEKEHVVMQDFKKCINCMKCVSVCLPKARNQIGRLVAAGDVLREVEKEEMQEA